MIITPPDIQNATDRVEIPKMFEETKAALTVMQPQVAKTKNYFVQRLKVYIQALWHALQPKVLWQHLAWSNLKRLVQKYALITCTLGAGMYMIEAFSPFFIKDTRPNSLSQNIYENNLEQSIEKEELLLSNMATLPIEKTIYKAEEDLLLQDLKSIAMAQQASFLERFGKVAQNEMQKYDIPASIILGLSIAYTRFGNNALAMQKNNYFATQCGEFEQGVGVIGQTNAEFNPNFCFLHFENAWSSFRTHSLLLSTAPYKELASMAQGDYSIWARGLEELGYRSQNNGFSAASLIAIIESFELQQYDKNI